MLESMRSSVLLLAALLAGCSSAPPPPQAASQQAAPHPADPTQDPAYAQAVAEVAAFNRRAESLLAAGKSDDASAVITESGPLVDRLLAAPRTTLEAMEAAADHDDLYGRMLLANRNYGWARMTFQKNVIRWKNWKPQTSNTVRRLRQAQSALAECDRKMTQ